MKNKTVADEVWGEQPSQDDEHCLRCGSANLDTGWECTECGFDNFHVYGPPSQRTV